MKRFKRHLNRITVGLLLLWVILAGLMVWRITVAFEADRWGFAIAIAMIGWLGGLVTAILGEIFLVRNRDNW